MTIMMAMTKTKIMTTTKENDGDNVKINNDRNNDDNDEKIDDNDDENDDNNDESP